MKYLFAAVYVLVLATQLPHIWYAYASLENPNIPLAQWTALGAAIAFELSTGVFTYRIVKGSRRRWTKRGLAFFIVASIVANGYYYQVFPFIFAWLMPVFATLALPIALALFAEEFGVEVKRGERKAKREAKQAEPSTEQTRPAALPFVCARCGAGFETQAALSGHGNAHRNGNERKEPLREHLAT